MSVQIRQCILVYFSCRVQWAADKAAFTIGMPSMQAKALAVLGRWDGLQTKQAEAIAGRL
eukprot:1154105-Pelagomonas_calceolata.AAC.3